MKEHGVLIFYFVFFMKICHLTSTKINILSCEASFNQNARDCSQTFDGVTGGNNGWAIWGGDGFPQNVVYELEKLVNLDHVRILTAVDGDDHHLTSLRKVKKIYAISKMGNFR